MEMTDTARRKTGMNQERMNPATGLVFRPVGRNLRVGNWSLIDIRFDAESLSARRIFHYDTYMGTFIRRDGSDVWQFVPVSVGHGSVSDQQGMNRILWGTGWKYRRNNGCPRYEYYGDVVFPVSQETNGEV